MVDPAFQISKLTGEFVDPSTERAFVASRWTRISKQLRIVSAICILAHGSAIFVNYLDLGIGRDLLWIGLGRGVSVLNIPLEFGRGNLKKFRFFRQGSIQ